MFDLYFAYFEMELARVMLLKFYFKIIECNGCRPIIQDQLS